jgi:hypothetical protein
MSHPANDKAIDDLNDYIYEHMDEIIQALWERENHALNDSVEWALSNNPKLMAKVVEFARTDSACEDSLNEAITKYAIEVMGYDPRMEPEAHQDR